MRATHGRNISYRNNSRAKFDLWLLLIAKEFSRFVFTAQLFKRAEIHVYLHVMCPLFLSNINQIRVVSKNLSKTPQYQIPWKSFQQLDTCYMQTDGQIDRAQVNRAFLQLLVANALKMAQKIWKRKIIDNNLILRPKLHMESLVCTSR
jgi:hypothetical protein